MATVASQSELQSAISKAAGRCILVLFGASGDLTKRKLVPALFNLAKAGLLSQNFGILGVAVDDLNDERFRDQVSSFLPVSDQCSEVLQSFKQRLYYFRGNFSDRAM